MGSTSIAAVTSVEDAPSDERAKSRPPNEIDVNLGDGLRQGIHVTIDHGLNERSCGCTLPRALFTTKLEQCLIPRHRFFFDAPSARSTNWKGGLLGRPTGVAVYTALARRPDSRARRPVKPLQLTKL
jgi:hypothetical protein